LKFLHLSHHIGCAADLSYVFRKLGHEIDYMLDIHEYNIGPGEAARLWEKHRAVFEQYDGIVTSDTAPLSRIFLQNNWSKPLIIWICTRLDYADQASQAHLPPSERFPDPEYYVLFDAACRKPNVRVVSYTEFEHLYARDRGMSIGDLVIKPTGCGVQGRRKSLIPESVDRAETFFIPPYHNDTKLLDLQGMCQGLGIKAYRGRYAGPDDLKGFKGIIHIPYAWSNLALFENWHRGLMYLIPSLSMLKKLAAANEYFWSPPYMEGRLVTSEWYCPENRKMFCYADSWEDMARIAKGWREFSRSAVEVKADANDHAIKQLSKWKNVLGSF